MFPDDDDLSEYTGGNVQLMIPSDLLQNISKRFITLVFTTLYVIDIPYNAMCLLLYVPMHLVGSSG